MGQCKTLPRGVHNRPRLLPSQCSAFHHATRDIFREGQHRPDLVSSTNKGTRSTVPSQLAFPPHLVPHAWFTWSPLGTQVLQCSCHMSSCSSLLLGLRGLQNHISPLVLDLLPHVAYLFLAVMLGCVTAPVMLVTTRCSRGAQGSPPGRCPAYSSRGHTCLVFVDLEGAGCSCKSSPHCSVRAFLSTFLLVWHCPISWSCFLPSFSPIPAFLAVALHHLAAGLQREVSQLATAT